VLLFGTDGLSLVISFSQILPSSLNLGGHILKCREEQYISFQMKGQETFFLRNFSGKKDRPPIFCFQGNVGFEYELILRLSNFSNDFLIMQLHF
jgi:hypothetical protein